MTSTVEVKCKNCKESFIARTADRKRGWGKFCSKSCKAKTQEAHTGQYSNHIHGGSDYKYTDGKGSYFKENGDGIDEFGDPCFIGVSNFDNIEHDCNKDLK